MSKILLFINLCPKQQNHTESYNLASPLLNVCVLIMRENRVILLQGCACACACVCACVAKNSMPKSSWEMCSVVISDHSVIYRGRISRRHADTQTHTHTHMYTRAHTHTRREFYGVNSFPGGRDSVVVLARRPQMICSLLLLVES